MRRNIKKAVVLLISAAIASQMVGCGKKNNTTDVAPNVSYWTELGTNAAQTMSNMGETELAKVLMEKFDTQIEYQHPAQGQVSEKFNIMVAMGNLPDIIEYTWSKYNGGVKKALSDGIIQEINIKKDAPNLYKYLKEHPEVDKMCKTDDGKYYGYPFIRGDKYLLTSAGLIIRDDWLEELGLEMPETIDEWTEVLRAFKSKSGVKSPLVISMGAFDAGCFVGAYNTYNGLYVDNGKVKYGPLDDSYKDFIVKMNEWYKEGLLDRDFASLESSVIQSNMLNGFSGVAYGSCGSSIGKWMAAAPDSKFSVTGAKYPVLKKGDTPEFGQYQNPVVGKFAVISRDCKNPELCKKILDYGYSEEGQMLFNFGIEGESYTMVDGYPTYTETITKNPEGLSMAASLAKYALSQYEGPFIQDKRYMEQYSNLPQQQTALENWSNTNMSAHMMPSVDLTAEQIDDISSLLASINTYKSEMVVKFIMGIEPIEKFDDFRNELRNRGVDRYVQYEQEAYERFLAR